jgi:GNAT superfamily N-acetyltransferase
VPVNFLPLAPGDTGRVVPLMARLYSHDSIRFDASRALRVSEWLTANPDWGGIWILDVDGRDAGYLVLTVCASIEFHGRMALLDELYIDDEFRNRGVGPAAIEFASQWSRDRGFSALRLELAADNTHALHVYEKSGFYLHHRRLMTKWLA